MLLILLLRRFISDRRCPYCFKIGAFRRCRELRSNSLGYTCSDNGVDKLTKIDSRQIGRRIKGEYRLLGKVCQENITDSNIPEVTTTDYTRLHIYVI